MTAALTVDVVTIFGDYLAPLDLSLIGRARREGLLDLRVHDLRSWTHDRHRTVDDTPYGGGAGMLMRPDPWGEALDELTAGIEPPPRLIVPTPAGRLFTQADAVRLAAEPRLVIACGRYEGIDARVLEYAATVMPVEELSIGDYVLNGGEVAALVMLEAICRLVPGVVGNAESVVTESHSDTSGGLLEAEAYTKPPVWRRLGVPEVLLSGDHGAIAAWRDERARRRTVDNRPDLLRQPAGNGITFRLATPADAGELLTLQLAAYVSEAQLNGDIGIAPLVDDVDGVRRSIAASTVLTAWAGDRLVGSARGTIGADAAGRPVWRIGRVVVAPDLRGGGLGTELLARIEALAPEATTAYELFTGARSSRNLRWYRRQGYRRTGEHDGLVDLVKPARGT